MTVERISFSHLLAKGISLAFIPPTVSTLTFTLLVITFEQGTLLHKCFIWLLSVLCSGILQMLYVLHLRSRRRVSAYDVPERSQRTTPYFLSVGISCLGFLLLMKIQASPQVVILMWCYAINTLFLAVINLKYKVSAHLVGLTGPGTYLYLIFGSATLVLIPLVLFLGWSRMRLKAHTLTEVLAGIVLGIILIVLQLELLRTYGIDVAASHV